MHESLKGTVTREWEFLSATNGETRRDNEKKRRRLLDVLCAPINPTPYPYEWFGDRFLLNSYSST
jgi:hypothetical protein